MSAKISSSYAQMHLHQHAKCRSSKEELKLLVFLNGGRIKPGNIVVTEMTGTCSYKNINY